MNESQASIPPEIRDDLRYIVIEGVIGAGKTTLAEMLASRFHGQIILEEFEQNPFLERFYADPERWAFQTQLTFLASRFRQQKALNDRDLFHQITVSDYSFDKDRIFAHLNLKADELRLYETLYTLMQPTTPSPDLIVYLQSTPERLLQNIKLRGRPYERNMDPEYIRALNDAYNYYFYRYNRGSLLIVNASKLDFVRRPDEFDILVREIVTKRHTAITYYNPL